MQAQPLRQQTYATQLEQGLAGGISSRLAFAPALEREYLGDKDRRAVLLLRFGCAVAVALYSVFFLLDFLTHRRLIHPVTFVLVFGIASPVTLIPAAATLVQRWRSRARQLAAPAVAINGAALIISLAFHTAHELPRLPYEVLILNLMYAYFLSGILFRVALPLGAGIVLAYLAAEGVAGLPLPEILDRGYVLGAFSVLAGISCFLLERAERRSWLRARLVQEMAIHDDLTGLHNRRHFYDEGERVLRQAQREQKLLGLMFVDVDRFKGYNDSLGHLAGDQCLVRVARALRESAQRPLDLVARLGGDEFVLLLYDIAPGTLLAHGEALRRRIEDLALPHPAHPGGRVSVSIGAQAVDARADTAMDALLQRADSALYGAKAAGRNNVQLAAAAQS